MSSVDIVLDNSKLTYYPGEKITGNLIVHVVKPLKVQRIWLTLQLRFHAGTLKIGAFNDYRRFVQKPETLTETKSFPFVFTLVKSCHPTMQGCVLVTVALKAECETSTLARNVKSKINLFVRVAPLNLFFMPHLELQQKKSDQFGETKFVTSIPCSYIILGKTLKVTHKVTNNNATLVIRATLKQVLSWRVQNSPQQNEWKSKVFEVNTVSNSISETQNSIRFSQELTVPANKIETFGETGYNIVSAKYNLEINILCNKRIIKTFVFPIVAAKETIHSLHEVVAVQRPSAPPAEPESALRQTGRVSRPPSYIEDTISIGPPPSYMAAISE
jgi:hypothetical protein|uniref:Arrestin C-terminal-like domain-containing protein n=1 Tax=Panagrolaimus sp. PS1159 TaxID=55785 RepID=A0AC35ETK8_9BILA